MNDTYYCVRMMRDPDTNPGNLPCPDTDKCTLCGNCDESRRPIAVLLEKHELGTILSALEELAAEKLDILENGPYRDEDEEADCLAEIAGMKSIVNKLHTASAKADSKLEKAPWKVGGMVNASEKVSSMHVGLVKRCMP